ncbi:hypothetical protein BZZ01_22340 [Nostocales cyanobacterium HT-58-2]|nr:hypothetical protein BZZ01_22340 [Nostocales cyanobacterium HT-58-2]
MPVNSYDANFSPNSSTDLQNLSKVQVVPNFLKHGLNEDFSLFHASNSGLADFSDGQVDAYPSNYSASERQRLSRFFDLSSDEVGDTLTSFGDIALESEPIRYKDFIGDLNKNDYYRFSLGVENTNFKLVLDGLSANADVQLLNSSGQVIGISTNDGITSESLGLQNLQPGTYYIRVYQGVSGANTDYNLTFSAQPLNVVPQPTAPEPAPVAPVATAANPFIQRVVDLTNTERQKAGLQPLKLNLNLTNTAQSHSEDMALRDFFSHTGSNGSSMGDRALATGYRFSALGENIAAGYTTPEEVIQGWMNNPGHRENILNPNYQEIGVGYYNLANDTGTVNYRSYWTQDFRTAV